MIGAKGKSNAMLWCWFLTALFEGGDDLDLLSFENSFITLKIFFFFFGAYNKGVLLVIYQSRPCKIPHRNKLR